MTTWMRSEIPFLGMNDVKETTRQKVENCSLLMYTIVYLCYDRILMTHLAAKSLEHRVESHCDEKEASTAWRQGRHVFDSQHCFV